MDITIYRLRNLHQKLRNQYTGAHKLAYQGAAMHGGQWRVGQQEKETQPATTGRLSLLFEHSHIFCPKDNHNPLSHELQSQIKNYRVKMNSQDAFFHSLSTGTTIRQQDLESKIQTSSKSLKKEGRSSSVCLTDSTSTNA